MLRGDARNAPQPTSDNALFLAMLALVPVPVPVPVLLLLLVLVLTAALAGRMVFSCSWAVYFTDCAARYPPAQWVEQCGAIPWDDDYINDKCHMWRCKSSACSARASSPLLFSPRTHLS